MAQWHERVTANEEMEYATAMGSYSGVILTRGNVYYLIIFKFLRSVNAKAKRGVKFRHLIAMPQKIGRKMGKGLSSYKIPPTYSAIYEIESETLKKI